MHTDFFLREFRELSPRHVLKNNRSADCPNPQRVASHLREISYNTLQLQLQPLRVETTRAPQFNFENVPKFQFVKISEIRVNVFVSVSIGVHPWLKNSKIILPA